MPLARKYLPEQVPLAPKFYVVMGGRAGAAGLDNQHYFDPVSSAWRSSVAKSPATSPAKVVEFFAHAAHHLGYGQILERKQAAYHFTSAENQAWSFLSAVMMEGSATFLINSLGRIPDSPTYLAKVPELLPAMQGVLRKALAGP